MLPIGALVVGQEALYRLVALVQESLHSTLSLRSGGRTWPTGVEQSVHLLGDGHAVAASQLATNDTQLPDSRSVGRHTARLVDHPHDLVVQTELVELLARQAHERRGERSQAFLLSFTRSGELAARAKIVLITIVGHPATLPAISQTPKSAPDGHCLVPLERLSERTAPTKP